MIRPSTVPISVVICTRDRPEHIRRCLESVGSLRPRPQEVIVVDQGLATPDLPAELCGVKHVRTVESGLSRARNVGVASASTNIVAFLDDDCVVGPRWAGDVASAFERHRDAGLIFGNVVGRARAEGLYVPAYSIVGERRLAGRLAAAKAHGMGAAMYMRASTAKLVGAFDVGLGAGSEFHASEDWDFTFRALACGVVVVETATIVVQHHGGRAFADGSARELLRRNAYSHGAVHAKLLRCLDGIALTLIVAELLAMFRLLRPLNVILGRPTNAARIAMYARGFAAGMRASVDRRQRLFQEQPARVLREVVEPRSA